MASAVRKKTLFVTRDSIIGIVGAVNIVKGLTALLPPGSASWLGAIPLALGLFVLGMSIWQTRDDLRRIREEEGRFHSLIQDDKQFFSFFSDWYNNSDPLTIITNDLDWVNKEENGAIYSMLLRKSHDKELTLLLNQERYQRAQNDASLMEHILEKEGAKVYVAPDNLVRSYTFSCLFRGDYIKRIIVRNKVRNQQNDSGEIVFEEITEDTNNSPIIDLLGALIGEITKESEQETAKGGTA